MATDMSGLRTQILANAKYMMFSNINKGDQADAGTKLPTLGSVATLVTSSTTTTGTSTTSPANLEVVVYGDGSEFKAAVVCGIYPVIEGATGISPEGAMRKLLLSSSELLNTIMPKLGSHQRNIHGGGVVDEDFLSRDLIDKKV
ncbi:hypothetical protein M409DRAFT_27421 [Zasmidium cellare ATCC 36951]|uniref:Uncharacterized protein n=1 Tax=Zasmidium cellare ATCC 36951 TaxID=1080233 RepID=A0A6A6C4T8_ZASCE|nr:uncharacterized protein M409DRAFT_27421 [Zasmidium cellare ATCC 36951]KAF2162041.1 hypothetical protein M409DRAFT_27421 [Zasmidium cellare ATCC 36951]